MVTEAEKEGDWKPSPEFLAEFRRLARKRKEARQQLRKEALAKAQMVARSLKEKWEAIEVYLYGSLAWGAFHERSDIDLFVVGFKGDYWRMLVEAEEIAHPFPVSVVCEEDAFPPLKEKVLREGVVL